MRTPTDTIGQHIHLVKFDVTASDGSANGWNYEDGTFAKGAIAERLHAGKVAGGSIKNPDGAPVNLPGVASYQTTIQRWFADPLVNRAGQDRTIRTVFTHDHFAASTIQQHGFYSALVVEPPGSTWLNPQGTALAGGVGTQAMIVGASDPQTHPDHREFMMAVADFAIVYTAGGLPVNPPDQPEAISSDDPGTMLVNYRNEPIPMRIAPNGRLLAGDKGNMAMVFDTSIHGEPSTEIFKAFEGDRIDIGVIQGAQEEQHVLSVHGMRWRREPNNPQSPFINAQEVGISEHFELDVPSLPQVELARSADYLYHFGSADDFWNGDWGFIRAFSDPNATDPQTKKKVALAPLPTNPTGRVSIINEADFTADGCPVAAPLREFDVQAWAAKDLIPGGAIVYNSREGIADPSGLLVVHTADVAAFQAGLKKVEPLILRANAGDCIRLKLANKLPPQIPDHLGDAPLPPITGLDADDIRPSKRISLHPQLVSYNITKDDGATIGRNKQQTADLGAVITYTWYAGVISIEKTPAGAKKVATPVEFGPINLQPFGDVIKHGAQGLVAALIVEPQGSIHVDPATGAPALSGTVAKITAPDGTSFKEFVLVYQDGLNLLENGVLMPNQFVADDPEDAGEKAINYRTEPFCARLGLPADCDTNEIAYPATFMLGPIETPLFTASPGEAVRFRVVEPSGRARQRGFSVLGHDYPDGGLPNFGASGNSLVAVGKAFDAVPYGGAKAGSWIYRDAPTFMLSGGAWGQFEVK